MVRTATPPVIDGKLDEAVWQTADVITDFHQIRPGDGATPSEPTEVYLLYDDDAFYIGARMHDSEPQLIVAPTGRHGQGLGPDDRLVVILDPFNTGRSGYRFETNANGVRHDALYTNVSSFQSDWTVIWDTAATDRRDGLGRRDGDSVQVTAVRSFDLDTWGFNFGRGIRRRGEEMAWVSRNRTYNPSILGLVTGLTGMDQGMGLDIVPSLAVGQQKAFVSGGDDPSDSSTNPSLDVFYRFTPSLNGALTINTDFSATEVDDAPGQPHALQSVLPREARLLLDRRGSLRVRPHQRQRLQRRQRGDVAAEPRERAAVLLAPHRLDRDWGCRSTSMYGGKVSGRVGRWSVGSLAIRQDEFGSAGQPGYVEAKDLFVGRVTANVLEESTVGIVMTDGNPQSNVDNSVVGADFRFLNSRIAGGRVLEADAWYQQSDTPGLVDDDAAFGFGVSLPNTAGFRGGVSVKEIERNFNPALGFISRADVRDTAFDVGYTRFFEGGTLQRLNFGLDAQRFDLLDGGGLQSESSSSSSSSSRRTRATPCACATSRTRRTSTNRSTCTSIHRIRRATSRSGRPLLLRRGEHSPRDGQPARRCPATSRILRATSTTAGARTSAASSRGSRRAISF